MDDIDDTLARLTGEALIDDAEAARTFVSSRLRRGSIGPRKLWAQLRQRGVDQEVAQSTIDALVDDETELALAAAERWQRRRSRTTTSDRDGLARHLNSAGFNSSSIVTALRAMLDAPS